MERIFDFCTYGLSSTGKIIIAGSLLLLLFSCQSSFPPEPLTLVEKGEHLFLNETFGGNGRTCGTCHKPTDNFGLSTAFIATLPKDDPLFVAEFNPDLASNFENTKLIRSLSLILENQDGFDDLENNFNQRGIPHTLALRTSVESKDGPRTGWSGDGAPGDGSLRAFATGAVIQHFTKRIERVFGVDFRIPTDEELDALEAFQLSLGRQQDLQLPLSLTNPVALRGQEIFMDNGSGKCNACHFNAGANGNPAIFGPGAGNLNFNTGVESLPDTPAFLSGEFVPVDDGFGIPGNGEFNTPPLVEAADTSPFFHNNSVETIEAAVAFYNGESFNTSPAGLLIIGATGSGINLDATQIVAVAAFLRVINALENIRSSDQLLARIIDSKDNSETTINGLLDRAYAESEDATQVLDSAGLHPQASILLKDAMKYVHKARKRSNQRQRNRYINDAASALEKSKRILINS